ncbi:MAG: hypothetical protein K6E20_05920 [Acholeplasmatales bacterium]|nr:hypothetical protein [Acholeplasmatales bacterium]
MKFLGMELSISKTIIYVYDEDTKIEELVYNQSSVCIVPNGNQKKYYFGKECFKEEISGHYTFKSMYFEKNPVTIKEYIKYLFAKIKDKIRGEFNISYFVINRYPNSNIFDQVMSDLISSNQEFSNVKLLFNDSIKLLNIELASLLYKNRDVKASNILTMNLDDFSYDYSIFYYDGVSNVPQTDKILFDLNFTNSTSSDLFSNIGLYAFLFKMLESAIRRTDTDLKIKLSDFNNNEDKLCTSQLFYKIIYALAKNIGENINAFYKVINKPTLKINYESGGKKCTIDLSYEDYNYALNEIVYSKYGLRKSLLNAKKELDKKHIGYKLIPYGSFYSIVEIKALVDQIFGKDNIITLKYLDNKEMMDSDSFTHVAKGAIESTKLTYEGDIPSVSFINYDNSEIEIICGSSNIKKRTNLLLSTTLSGLPFYVLNKEFSIPLAIQTDEAYLKNNASKIRIGDKEISLYDYLYNKENYRLLSLTNIVDSKDWQEAKLRIGLIKNRDKNPSIVFDLYNDKNRYKYEFIVEMEGL